MIFFLFCFISDKVDHDTGRVITGYKDCALSHLHTIQLMNVILKHCIGLKNQINGGPEMNVKYTMYSWWHSCIATAKMFGMNHYHIECLTGRYEHSMQYRYTNIKKNTEMAIKIYEKKLQDFVIPTWYKGYLMMARTECYSNDKKIDNIFTEHSGLTQLPEHNWLSSQLDKQLPSPLQFRTNISAYPVRRYGKRSQINFHETNPGENSNKKFSNFEKNYNLLILFLHSKNY